MKLAVFMPNWIGDAVMATPALRAVRRQFPRAHIVGVLKPYVAGVLEGGDLVDEMLFSGDGTWGQGVFATAWKLRKRGIDLAILFPNSFRTALVARLGGCRRRIGYARYGRSFLLTDALEPVRGEHGRPTPSPVLDAYNLLAERAGCEQPGTRMELCTTPADEDAAERVWQKTGLRQCREVICFNSGAAFGAAKYWPLEHFAELARALLQQRDRGILVLCGPSEREQCRELVTAVNDPRMHGLADEPLSIGLTKACVKRCDLLVTTDSGPRHFAAAFGRPVVTLFGPTHIEWTETYFPRAIHLQKKLDCGPCQQRVCPLRHHRCMKELLPDEVLIAVERLLRQERKVSA